MAVRRPEEHTGVAAPPVVLVLDYPGAQTSGTIAELIADLDGVEVRYPFAHHLPAESTALDYAEAVLSHEEDVRDRVVAVLSNCMSAPIAHEIGALLERSDRPAVDLLLFDASPCTSHGIRFTFRKITAELVSSVANGGGPVQPAADWLDDHILSDDPDLARHRIRDELRPLVRAVLTQHGVEQDDFVDQAVDVYLSWLTHMIAAFNSTAPPWRGTVHHVVSRGHRFTEDWPGAGATALHRTTSAPTDLLRDRETAALAVRLLGDIVSLHRPA